MKCPYCNGDFEKVDVDIGQARQIVDHCKNCNAVFFKGEYKGQLYTYADWKVVE